MILPAALAAVLVQTAPIAPARAPGTIVLRMGTEVPLRTVAEISSKYVHQGDRFALEVSEDVVADGVIVLKAGTPAVGEISRVVEKGMFGKPGKLDARALFVELGGYRIRLDGRIGERGKSATAPAAASVLLVGPWAGFVSGTHARVPAGTRLTGYVYEDVVLRFRN